MTHDDERTDGIDLDGLAAPEAVRERVVTGALERIAAEAGAPPAEPFWRAAVDGAGSYLVPALAAAALVALLLVEPNGDAPAGVPGGGGPPPATGAATVQASPLVPAPGPWREWLAAPTPPTPAELIVTFTAADGP